MQGHPVPVDAARRARGRRQRVFVAGAAIAALALGAFLLWNATRESAPLRAFASGNGRIEATELHVAAKVAGRVAEVLVSDGDYVEAGAPLVRLRADGLEAQLAEAKALRAQAAAAVAAARAQLAVRHGELAASKANALEAQAVLRAARRRCDRSESLAKDGAVSQQQLDDDRAQVEVALASSAAADARIVAAEAIVAAQGAQIAGAEASEVAAGATQARVEADLAECVLVAPRSSRVQFLVAQPGEVLAVGQPAVSLVDLGEVYMTFFLPETIVGRVALGGEARIVLDAAPEAVVPARIIYISSVAQFTPKTVETASERQKLMFRVRAGVDPALLARHRDQVKTGLPGVAWVRLDDAAPWPSALAKPVQ